MKKNEEIVSEEEFQQLKQGLEKSSHNEFELFKYEGFWYDDYFFKNIIKCQRHFIAKDTDIFITSFPKTGTTWLKSLLFSIVNRSKYPITEFPLLNHNPHELVYGLETHIYATALNSPIPNDISQIPEPRLLSTHLPYASLPASILESSKCKILYIARNPSDTLLSMYHFLQSEMERIQLPPLEFEDFFNDFVEGKHAFGPYMDQVVEYWKISLEEPEKVLFLKYEDLKRDPMLNLKKVAEFLGMPFSAQEEKEGLIDQIIELCSFRKMKELEVNKSGVVIYKELENKTFFRKGEVGDWTNHFTPLMVKKMDELTHQKLLNTGLSFDLLPVPST